MVNSISGASINAKYGWELVAFATRAAAVDKPFGFGTKISTFSAKNNLERIYGLGSRDMQTAVAKKFEGAFSAEFILGNAYWLRGFFGTPSDAGSGPYTHTYSTAAMDAAATAPPSLTIDVGANTDTKIRRTLLGCRINQVKLAMAVNEPVKVVLDGLYADEDVDTTEVTTLADTYNAPMSFAEASLQVPTGSTLSDVQSLTMTWKATLEYIWGLGSKVAQQGVRKNREYEFNITSNFEQVNGFLQKLHGSASGVASGTPTPSATLLATITNGGATTALRSLIGKWDNFYVDTHDLEGLSAEDIVKENVFGFCTNLNATSNLVYTDNTAVAP